MDMDLSTMETHNQCKLLKTKKEEKNHQKWLHNKTLADVNQKILF